MIVELSAGTRKPAGFPILDQMDRIMGFMNAPGHSREQLILFSNRQLQEKRKWKPLDIEHGFADIVGPNVAFQILTLIKCSNDRTVYSVSAQK